MAGYCGASLALSAAFLVALAVASAVFFGALSADLPVAVEAPTYRLAAFSQFPLI
jgi:hypothetical protein